MYSYIFHTVFAADLKLLVAIALMTAALWFFLAMRFSERKIWKNINIFLFAASLFVVFRFTLMRRGSEDYYISLSLLEKLRKVKGSHDLDREIFMNALLFFPLGLSFSQTVYRGDAWRAYRKTVLFAFLLSFFIEFMQFAFSSGNTEMSDLVFNVLGAAIGALPVLFAG